MATKFLDYVGFAYFWNKLKVWIASAASNLVHITGNETIIGEKIFSSFLYAKDTEAVKGTLPSEATFTGLAFIDSSNNPSTAIPNELNSRLGFAEHATYTSGTSELRLGAYKFTTDLDHQTDQAILAVGYTSTGIKYAYAPSTPEDYLRGDAIITYNWLPKDTRIVHTTGNENISGIKTFSGDVVINQSTLKAIVKDTDSDTTRTDTIVKANSANSGYGINTLFGSGSNCIIGAGEGKDSQLDELAGQMSENVYIVADGGIYLKPNANTFANAKDIWFNPSGGVTFTIHNITRGTAPSNNFEVMPVEVRDSATNRIGILSVAYFTDKSSLSALYAYNTTAATGANIGRLGIGCDSLGHVYTVAPTPSASDNSTKIATTAFVNTFIANDTRQTSSDRRLKTPISEINGDVLDAWENVFWGEFKFLSSVKEKGNAARFHIGLIAQDVDKICTANNIDICHYGILCHDTHSNGPNELAEDLWTIRYTEALCMEAAYQRRENARLKKRIADLEERLAALELKVS